MNTHNLKLFAVCLLITVLPGANEALAQRISPFGKHSAAICDDGNVFAWGFHNQTLGDSAGTIQSSTPIKLKNLSGIIAIANDSTHSLALKNDSTVWAWGSNQNGQLGIGNNIDQPTPVRITSLSGKIAAVATGADFSIALKDDGTVWAWGFNYYGQLGDGSTIDRNAPVQVTNLSNVVGIGAGFGGGYAIKNDGTLWAWGLNYQGELGNGNTSMNSSTPVQVSNLSNVVAVTGGLHLAIALKSDGTVWSWGSGYLGGTIISTPVQVNGLSNITAIDAGESHSLALKSDGTVLCWGANYHGLGDGITTNSSTPVVVSNISNAVAIAAGVRNSVVVKADGSVYSWGQNYAGQLGDGTTIDRTTPVLCALHLSECAGINTGAIPAIYSGSLAVPFTAVGSYDADNSFTAQLSDANGSFDNPTDIGSTAPASMPAIASMTASSTSTTMSTPNTAPTAWTTIRGSINATIPAGIIAGSGYRIRVVSSSPAVIGTDNGTGLSKCPALSVTPSIADVTTFCKTNTIYKGYGPQSITISVSPATGYNYHWSNGATGTSITVSPTETSAYSVMLSDANGCAGTAVTVKVKDVRCGNNLQNIYVCHVNNGNHGYSANCMSPTAVPTHLAAGDCLGDCTASFARHANASPEEAMPPVIRTYPSPARDIVHVDLGDMGSAYRSYEVSDVSGRVLMQANFEKEANVQSVQLDVSKLAAGIYTLRAIAAEASSQARFVIE